MTTAWEALGVDAALDLVVAKHGVLAAEQSGQPDDARSAADRYIKVLEGALDTLGIHIDPDGAVTPSDTTGHSVFDVDAIDGRLVQVANGTWSPATFIGYIADLVTAARKTHTTTKGTPE